MANKLQEGEKYPEASAVILLVYQILTDLGKQETQYKEDLKRFTTNLKNNLKKSNCFPDTYWLTRLYKGHVPQSKLSWYL